MKKRDILYYTNWSVLPLRPPPLPSPHPPFLARTLYSLCLSTKTGKSEATSPSDPQTPPRRGRRPSSSPLIRSTSASSTRQRQSTRLERDDEALLSLVACKRRHASGDRMEWFSESFGRTSSGSQGT